MENKSLNSRINGAAPGLFGPLQILLIGNYLGDRQESMLRFADVMCSGLQAEQLCPNCFRLQSFWGVSDRGTSRGSTWLAYIDKFLIFPFILRRTIRKVAGRTGNRFLIHICDHSNAMYTAWTGNAPVVVTCHDLLAVRGSLGEETDCAASPFGKILQRWILRGLARASVIACVSTATLRDVERILQPAVGGAQTQLVPMGLNHDYRPLAPEEAEARLAASSLAGRPFVLHVGSNLRRKNREGVLRSFAGTAAQWNGQLVIAGQPFDPELWSLAGSLEITERIVEVTNPSNEMLEALYNRATALIFPSRFEGFGWPIIEAQACGCPVICSDIPPLPEVAGEAALVCAVEDVAGFSSAILRLANPGEREAWARKGLANVRRFATHRMIGDYLAIYERTNAQV